MRSLTGIVFAGVIAGCAPPAGVGNGASTGSTPPAPELVADTIVGVVREVGSDPGTWLVLAPNNAATSLRIAGSQVPLLRSVLGAEVWTRGRTSGGEIDIVEFEVRRVGGRLVDDGVVVRDGNGLALQLRSGRIRPIPDPPPALQQLVGGRVWITPAATGQSPTFGAIRRPN